MEFMSCHGGPSKYKITTITTCLRGLFGSSCSILPFPVIFLFSLCFNPRAKQPFRSSTPTLPASPNPIWTRVSQLAARAWPKPADWCHKMDERRGREEDKDRNTEGRKKQRVSTLMFLWMTKDKWEKWTEWRSHPTVRPRPRPCISVWVCVQPRCKLFYATRLQGWHSCTIV